MFGIAGVAGNAIAGVVTDRLGAAIVIWISIIGLVAMFLSLLTTTSPGFAVALISGCALFGTLFTAPQQTRLTKLVHPNQHGVLLGLNVSAGYIGIAIGSSLATFLYDELGARSLPVVAINVAVVAVLTNLAAAFRFSSSSRQ